MLTRALFFLIITRYSLRTLMPPLCPMFIIFSYHTIPADAASPFRHCRVDIYYCFHHALIVAPCLLLRSLYELFHGDCFVAAIRAPFVHATPLFIALILLPLHATPFMLTPFFWYATLLIYGFFLRCRYYFFSCCFFIAFDVFTLFHCAADAIDYFSLLFAVR